MSLKARQITNFFTTGTFTTAAVDAELKSGVVADVTGNNPKVFTWANVNMWRDLESGRNALNVNGGMEVTVRKNGRYAVVYSANLLARSAQIVYKFDAFDDTDEYLYTFVTKRQSLTTHRYTELAVQSPPRSRGVIDEIRGLSDLNEISYLVRRGAGKTRD